MVLSQSQLEHDLQNIGLQEGDIVMVHASLRAVGKIEGGGDTLIAAILETISKEGTLVAYVDFEPTKEIPYFDVAKSPASSHYGVLAELIRANPNAVRSKNPGGSMSAIGKDANWICREHNYNYGYGANSPLEKIYQKNGKILLLGSDIDSVTILHYAEAIADLPKKRVIRYEQEVLIDGQIKKIKFEEFDTSKPILDEMPEKYFEQTVKAFIAANKIGPRKVGNAASYLFSAKGLVDFAVEKIEREFGNK